MPSATQLTEDQIAEMIRLRQADRGIKALALQFHIGPDRVRRLAAGTDAPAPPVVRPLLVRPLPVRFELDDDDDTVNGDTMDSDTVDSDTVDGDAVDEARLVDDDTVDEFIAAFEGVAPLARPFMARGFGGLMAEVLVDAADYDRVMRGPAWRLQRTNYGRPGPACYYVVRGHGAAEYLHRVVMEDEIASWTGPSRAVVDHINGNRLDNRRLNLRVVTCRENNANRRKLGSLTSSRFKWVDLHRGRWRAMIRKQGRKVHLGYFDDEEDAARAYDAAARAEFGEFACLNFAREGEQYALPLQPAAEAPAAEAPTNEAPAVETSGQ